MVAIPYYAYYPNYAYYPIGGLVLPSTNLVSLQASYPSYSERRQYPIIPKTPLQNVRKPEPTPDIQEDWEAKLRRGVEQGITDSRMHLINTLLMGLGTVLLPVIPNIRKHMPYRMAIQMAPVHMALMLFISFMLGFINGFQRSPLKSQSRHH